VRFGASFGFIERILAVAAGIIVVALVMWALSYVEGTKIEPLLYPAVTVLGVAAAVWVLGFGPTHEFGEWLERKAKAAEAAKIAAPSPDATTPQAPAANSSRVKGVSERVLDEIYKKPPGGG
jgi:hypothetical protein